MHSKSTSNKILLKMAKISLPPTTEITDLVRRPRATKRPPSTEVSSTRSNLIDPPTALPGIKMNKSHTYTCRFQMRLWV